MAQRGCMEMRAAEMKLLPVSTWDWQHRSKGKPHKQNWMSSKPFSIKFLSERHLVVFRADRDTQSFLPFCNKQSTYLLRIWRKIQKSTKAAWTVSVKVQNALEKKKSQVSGYIKTDPHL